MLQEGVITIIFALVEWWVRLRGLVLVNILLGRSLIVTRGPHIGEEAIVVGNLLITRSVGGLNRRINLRRSKIYTSTIVRTHEIIPGHLQLWLTRTEVY